MAVFLFSLIFLAMSALSSLVSLLIFPAAHLLVLIIQGFSLPGQAVQAALQLIADAIRACFEYILEYILEMISSSISAAFDLVMEAITGSATFTGSAIGGLVEKTRDYLDGLLEDNSLSQLAEDFTEMISTIMTDLWNNYKDAAGYVTENA